MQLERSCNVLNVASSNLILSALLPPALAGRKAGHPPKLIDDPMFAFLPAFAIVIIATPFRAAAPAPPQYD